MCARACAARSRTIPRSARARVCVCDNIMYRYGMCEYELMVGVELFTLLYLAFVLCFLATLF